jgi:hypothetical protein
LLKIIEGGKRSRKNFERNHHKSKENRMETKSTLLEKKKVRRSNGKAKLRKAEPGNPLTEEK